MDWPKEPPPGWRPGQPLPDGWQDARDEPQSPPAGWYVEESNSYETERWWDGARWTDHVRPYRPVPVLQPQRRFRARAIAAPLAGIAVTLFVLVRTFGSPQPQPQPPVGVPTNEATGSAVNEWGPGIPGLAAVDVTGNLEAGGFTCTGPRTGEGLVAYSCESMSADGAARYIVEMDGPAPDELLGVEALAVTEGTAALPDEAGEMLAFVATLPYRHARPGEARAWVRAAWSVVDTGAPRTRSFGPVEMTLAGNSSLVTLYLEPAPAARE